MIDGFGSHGEGSRDQERRTHRSADALAALSRLLDGARRRSGLDALAVADETGILVAGAGAFRACEQLAAEAPFLDGPSAPANDTVPTRLDVLTRRSVALRVSVDGIGVLVCGRGASAMPGQTLTDVARGCVRIL